MTKSASFKAYILKQKPDESFVGDFIREAKTDKSFPTADSWQDLRIYLKRRDGGEQSIVAGRSLWKEYQKNG